MSISLLNDAVTEMVMSVRHRELPSEAVFQRVLANVDLVLSGFDDSIAIPKGVVRTLLDLVSLTLLHAPDSPDEARLIDMYLEINELLMRKIL